MDRLRITSILDGLALVMLVWYDLILIYCPLSHFKSNFDAISIGIGIGIGILYQYRYWYCYQYLCWYGYQFWYWYWCRHQYWCRYFVSVLVLNPIFGPIMHVAWSDKTHRQRSWHYNDHGPPGSGCKKLSSDFVLASGLVGWSVGETADRLASLFCRGKESERVPKGIQLVMSIGAGLTKSKGTLMDEWVLRIKKGTTGLSVKDSGCKEKN